MDFNKKILDKIDNLVKLSSDFDSGFKIIFNLETNKINEETSEILYTMTKNYILCRKIHGELLLMLNKHINSIDYDQLMEETIKTKVINKKSKKSLEISNINSKSENIKVLYDISTFNTLINNINDLINNIDYEYKKIAVKYPKFINNSQIIIILITSLSIDEKYTGMICELKTLYPEHKYKIIKCGDKKLDIDKCEEELKDYDIKIKSLKSLPLIYIINGTTITEVPISKIDNIEPIKKLIE